MKKRLIQKQKRIQHHLFEVIDTLCDQDLTGDDLHREIKRAEALNELAKRAFELFELLSQRGKR